MNDGHIRLLPEVVANQIAAGEVIQRPASVVKELLENSLDASAQHIHLIIKDAGKQLIQVVDDGTGMNEIDLRMSIERHATSKIQTAEDLFHIQSYGFRGEALASIVSVSRVEMVSRTQQQQIGSRLILEGAQVISQEPVQCPVGTSITVKNLFFNVPARRQFLKSNSIEVRHIYDEFYRVAIPNYDIHFTLIENNTVLYKLEKTNLKQRIVQLFGLSYQKRLIAVHQATPYVEINGYIIHPQYARKQRGEQFLFVNNRFIKSHILHRVIHEAMKQYLAADTYPGYFLFFRIDPKEIDVNIHPTKTEIRFRDEQHIATILRSSIQYALAQHHVAPSLDFEIDPTIENIIWQTSNKPVRPPEIRFNPAYNPFRQTEKSKTLHSDFVKNIMEHQSHVISQTSIQDSQPTHDSTLVSATQNEFIVIGGRYLCVNNKLGLMLVDLHWARERIVYDSIIDKLSRVKEVSSQQLLYPETFHLSQADRELFIEIIPELENIGFRISDLGGGTFSCTAVPADWQLDADIGHFMEEVLENYKHHALDARHTKNALLAKAISSKMCSRLHEFRNYTEVHEFLNRLFDTAMPDLSPSGKKIFTIVTAEQLSKIIEQS